MSEEKRLLEHRDKKANWKKWGPYLSERSWGTVREDYGSGDAWRAFPFEEAHKRVYRWGEDGLGGICDRYQTICLAFALWNGKDPILKERIFGLSNAQGNHGEDVKDLYYYVDATPTSSYLKMVYKYPHGEFPYKNLVEENKKRGFEDPEYEILDTGIFNDDAYFDVQFEYAKEGTDDVLCRVTIKNRGKQPAPITVLPTIWFRNTWKWGYEKGPTGDNPGKPELQLEDDHIHLKRNEKNQFYFYVQEPREFIFCENDTEVPHPKDSFHHYVVEGKTDAVNKEKKGTKAAAVLGFTINPGDSQEILCRLSKEPQKAPFQNFSKIFKKRIEEADEFYKMIQNPKISDDLKNVQRQAFAGMLFSKQFYYLDQRQWQQGDPNLKPNHSQMRNETWDHLTTFDIHSMPDKWEYPYFCAWDTAFHCIPLVLVDPDFAKRQLTLMTREWYMHPSGQLPAYEWVFSDVNPPVHAWAVWRTYKIDAKKYGKADRGFLEGSFHKLLLNFTWWVNKKDKDGHNVFQGGFLGMDNISVFDRSSTLPTGGHIDQSDGSAWMSFFCISLMKIALHLAEDEPVYQDMATKFFEHFLRIAAAMSSCGGSEHSLWNKEDGFFYDVLHLPDGNVTPLKVRSLVGLIPMIGVETLQPDMLEKMPDFKRRMDWFISKRPDVSCNIACMYAEGVGGRRLMSILTKDQLISVLKYVLDENEFLSPYGIRSVSKYHEKNPYVFKVNGSDYEVKYIPGESNNSLFGGNSNWRGPIWFPINFLIIEALQRYHHYYGDELKVEFPTGSGNSLNLWDVASEISKRLIKMFIPGEDGKRPIFGGVDFHDHILFNEYYHGDNGRGVGASHQTGWTGLIAKLIEQSGDLL